LIQAAAPGAAIGVAGQIHAPQRGPALALAQAAGLIHPAARAAGLGFAPDGRQAAVVGDAGVVAAGAAGLFSCAGASLPLAP
jgi:hypothetical protein